MDALFFFLIGLPLAFAADRLIVRFERPEEPEALEEKEADHEPPARHLPWQDKPWSDHLRRGIVVFLPPLAAVAGSRFDPLQAFGVTLFVMGLLICTATDLLRYRVPNAITYPGTVLALIAAVVMPNGELLDAIVAALAGGGVFLIMAVVTRGGLGLGDVKLAVLIGAALGIQAAYQALLIGVAAGGLIILVLLLTGFVNRRQAVPYAPFLALAAVLVTLLHGTAFAPL
jgi:prepilin signal peptidase PulO-like enzyme (type II secretory pathway)